ncbi:hypothetical protein J31TS4_13500 [Paenibacillus sp. J31TS4]|nr:hypothetical protein J31TS4_13500 [Paenibacillus sp. J31TS4]
MPLTEKPLSLRTPGLRGNPAWDRHGLAGTPRRVLTDIPDSRSDKSRSSGSSTRRGRIG